MVDDEIPHENENNDSKPPRMGERWTDEERRDLIRMALNGHSWAEIAELLGRSKTAVMYEFAKLVEEGGWIEVKPPTITKKSDTAGSSPPPNDPRLSISGVGSTPPDDRCPTCSHPLGPRCETCGNCLQSNSVKISKEDFFLSNNSLYGHDINIDFDDLGQRYIDIKLKYEINQQTENEKLREWVWDYIESMGGKIDREKIRREQPLEDYEYYKENGDEDDHK